MYFLRCKKTSQKERNEAARRRKRKGEEEDEEGGMCARVLCVHMCVHAVCVCVSMMHVHVHISVCVSVCVCICVCVYLCVCVKEGAGVRGREAMWGKHRDPTSCPWRITLPCDSSGDPNGEGI